MDDRARHILVCLRYGIGDLIMELPVLAALRRRLPQARIAAIGARPATDLLTGERLVDDLFNVQDWGLHDWQDLGNPDIQRRLAAWLACADFDLVLDVSQAVRAVRDVIWEHCNAICDTSLESETETLSRGAGGLAAIHASIRGGWGMHVPEAAQPRIHPSRAELAWARKWLDHRALRERPLAISPVASSPLKCWPRDRWAALADNLIEQAQIDLLLLCGPQFEIAAEILARMRHAGRVHVLGSVPLRQVGALLAHCSAFVCQDTGLMHLAAALEVPLVAIFGPTSPRVYLPPGPACLAAEPPDHCCPYRHESIFGPALCLCRNQCLHTGACILDVSLEQVRHRFEQLPLERDPQVTS